MSAAHAAPFTLASPDLVEGGRVPMTHVYNGFGYTGGNRSPALSWSHIPAGTRSFAVTVHDPDAPKPGGWWHWLTIDIPAATTGLPEGVATGHGLPSAAIQMKNDFGMSDYGGPAPPPGKPHRYIFTVYALNVEKLGVAPYDPPAKVALALEKAALGKASIATLFGR